jgi:hypothetical protein
MRSLMLTTCFGFALAAVLGLATARAETIQSEGKCWINSTNGNYGWEACKPEHKKKETHHNKGEAAKPAT